MIVKVYVVKLVKINKLDSLFSSVHYVS
jgi:hypothetical protein